MSTVSIIVPCYNEAANIPLLLRRIDAALKTVEELEYDVLLIDDGSEDSTASVLGQCRLENSHVGFIRFVRNFGHQAALLAGLEHARGDAVIVMDADLQHPPELLPEMIRSWRCGFDVVQAIRRTQPGVAKSLSSGAFYSLLNWISEIEISNGAADFRLISRRAVDSLLALPERTRFVRGLISWLGFPCTTIMFEAPPRQAGNSGYNFGKMLGLAVDGVVTISHKPLHLALYAAGLTLMAVIVYFFFVIAQYARGVQLVPGWPSIILTTLILGSVNLLCTGILGLYVRATLVEIRRRPTYIASEYVPPTLEPTHSFSAVQSGETRRMSVSGGGKG
jgi:polyisoprenyl-phosphate glycosyltransferase